MSAPVERRRLERRRLLISVGGAHEVGLSTVVLAIVVAMLCAYVGILLAGAHKADSERRQLACQVQRLGGRPVGGVDCPRPSSGPSRAVPASSAPGPTVIVVLPDGSSTTSPAPARSPAAGSSSTVAPRRTTGPAPSPSRPPSPAATPHATPSPTPVARICLPRVPCFPRSVPRR